MKRVFQALAATILFAVLLILLLLRTKSVHVYDAFESANLSRIPWSRSRFAPGAVSSEKIVVRSGGRALSITVHSGDCFEAASDDGAASERAELMESWWLFSRIGRSYIYTFSLFLSHDFPQTSERLVIAQWKQVCEAARCRPDNPVLAIRYQNRALIITRQSEQQGKISTGVPTKFVVDSSTSVLSQGSTRPIRAPSTLLSTVRPFSAIAVLPPTSPPTGILLTVWSTSKQACTVTPETNRLGRSTSTNTGKTDARQKGTANKTRSSAIFSKEPKSRTCLRQPTKF